MNIVGIVGPPNCGKSTYLGRLVAAHRTPRRRFFIAQPYKGIKGVPVGTIDDLSKRETWPPVALIDDTAERVVRLALAVKNRTVVVDEAETWATKGYEDEPGSALSEVCRRGRHYRVYLIWASQSPWDVHVTLRSRTRVWIFFPFAKTDQHALRWIASGCGQAVADAVAQHTGYRPLVWTPEDGLRRSE